MSITPCFSENARAESAVALFASAWRMLVAEWLFAYREPPRLADLLGDAAAPGDVKGLAEHVRALIC